jgi:predicted nucleotidyltransferase
MYYNKHMKKLDEVISSLKELEPELTDKYKVKSLAVFGSFASNQQVENSDIDILVEFSEPVGFEFFRLQRFIEEKLGIKVDLVTKDAIKPAIEKNILRDLTRV